MVIDVFREMLNENDELAVAILDTLGNLCLESSDLIEVRADVIQTLPSAQLADVPVIVKFLLQTVNSSEDALEVCMCLYDLVRIVL